jgi:hypothetical protein
MRVSGQRHDPAALCIRGKDHRYQLYRKLGGLDTEVGGKISYLCQASNLDHSIFQYVARHYTDWGALVPSADQEIVNKIKR